MQKTYTKYLPLASFFNNDSVKNIQEDVFFPAVLAPLKGSLIPNLYLISKPSV